MIQTKLMKSTQNRKISMIYIPWKSSKNSILIFWKMTAITFAREDIAKLMLMSKLKLNSQKMGDSWLFFTLRNPYLTFLR